MKGARGMLLRMAAYVKLASPERYETLEERICSPRAPTSCIPLPDLSHPFIWNSY